ncbi:MAG: carbohydrate kinase [Planctomycetota bacterium]
MASEKQKVISIGEVLWDILPDGARLGGAPANVACHVARLGGEAYLASCVGDDDLGKDAIRLLQSYGVDTWLTQVSPNSMTGTASVELDATGKPTFSIRDHVAWEKIAWTNSLEVAISQSDAVYFGTLGQKSPRSRVTIRQAVGLARALGLPRFLDVNLRPQSYNDSMIRDSMSLASNVKLSDDELPEVARAFGVDSSDGIEKTMRQLLLAASLDSIVMTQGEDGATLVSAWEEVYQPGVAVSVCDTVGAGDAFAAAFVIQTLEGKPAIEALRFACVSAAQTCTHAGAIPSTRSSDDLQP